MSLTFVCDPNERVLPIAKRSKYTVMANGKPVAMISADADESVDRNHHSAIWKARILHGSYDPFKYEISTKGGEKTPYVESDENGVAHLVHPMKMDMSSARHWIRENYLDK